VCVFPAKSFVVAGFLVELEEDEMTRLAKALVIQGGQRITIMRELIRAYSDAVERTGALSLPLVVSSAPKTKKGK
jgi:hypothetical protein